MRASLRSQWITPAAQKPLKVPGGAAFKIRLNGSVWQFDPLVQRSPSWIVNANRGRLLVPIRPGD
jgi:hypothetical protein